MNSLETTMTLVSSEITDTAMGRKLLRGDLSRDEYVRYLRLTLKYVEKTQPLLELAAEQVRKLGGPAFLGELFEEKAKEEAGHDAWIVSDLQTLGEQCTALDCEGTTLYVLAHENAILGGAPEVFLGAAYFLEFLSRQSAGTAAGALSERGIPSRALTFLERHGVADIEHASEIEVIYSKLDSRAQLRVLQGIFVTGLAFRLMVGAIS